MSKKLFDIEMRVGYVGKNYQPIEPDKMEKMWARFALRVKEMFEEIAGE